MTVDSATTSGSITVTLPYDEATLGGVSEDDVILLHYIGGEWVTVENITIDKENNKVTGTVTSLSPFTVGTKTGTVTITTGGDSDGVSGGGGGGGGGITREGPGYTDYPFNIYSVSTDTCDANMARIIVGPEYDQMDIVVTTSTGYVMATMVDVDPIFNRVMFEAPLYTDRGALQVSATAFTGSFVLRATPFITTIMQCGQQPELEPEPTEPVLESVLESILEPTEQEQFQKPDAFITQIQCPIGTTLVDGECIPIRVSIITLLIILLVGLAMLLPGLKILRRRAELLEQLEITRRPVEEIPEELQKPPRIEIPEPEIEIPEPEIEIDDIEQLVNSLQEQTIIQERIRRMELQLLELTQEKRTIQRNLTALLEQVYQEVRPKVLPQLPEQLLALPAPKRKYTKKKRTLTDEHKAKIAAAKRGRKLTPQTKEKISTVKKGRKMSDEHKAKIAAAKRGRKMSDEHKAKIAAAHTGIKHTSQTKQKMSESKKQNKLDQKKKKAKLDDLKRRYDILSQGENDETT
ncbi:MAG: hypothetical protein DSZ14_02890 [Candidatus Thioglobus sp.]|nr:MAG: hypothetical protein DSZ14_02890 [Candidatus Thioglobus sp.]